MSAFSVENPHNGKTFENYTRFEWGVEAGVVTTFILRLFEPHEFDMCSIFWNTTSCLEYGIAWWANPIKKIIIFLRSCNICATLETFWVLMRNRTSDLGIHIPMPYHFISVTKSITMLNLSSIRLFVLTNSFTHSFSSYFFFPTDPSTDRCALMRSKSSIHLYWIYVFTWELRWQFVVSVALWCFPWQPSIVINLIDGPTMDFQGIDGTNHL